MIPETTYDFKLEDQLTVEIVNDITSHVSEHLMIKGSLLQENSQSQEIWVCPWDNTNGDLVLFI